MTLGEQNNAIEDGHSRRNIYGYPRFVQEEYYDSEVIGDVPASFGATLELHSTGYQQEYDAVSCAGSEITKCSICEKNLILCSLHHTIKQKEERISTLEEKLQKISTELSENKHILEEKEMMRESLICSIIEVFGWEMQDYSNEETTSKLCKEVESYRTQLTNMQILFKDEREKMLLENRQVQEELEKIKESYLLIASELETKKEGLKREMEKLDKITAENLLLKHEIEEMKSAQNEKSKYEKLDCLKRQLSMSEENVRTLVNILEGKDKLLAALMTDKMPENDPDRTDVRNEIRQQLNRMEIAREEKDREVIDLKAKLAASEIRLSKAKALITDMKKKSSNIRGEKSIEEQDLRKSPYNSSSKLQPQKHHAASCRNISPLSLVMTNMDIPTDEAFLSNNCSSPRGGNKSRLREARYSSPLNISMGRSPAERSPSRKTDCSTIDDLQQLDTVLMKTDTELSHDDVSLRSHSTEQDEGDFNNSMTGDVRCGTTEMKIGESKRTGCRVSETHTPNDSTILCHKTELNLPVTVQLVIEQSENMKQ